MTRFYFQFHSKIEIHTYTSQVSGIQFLIEILIKFQSLILIVSIKVSVDNPVPLIFPFFPIRLRKSAEGELIARHGLEFLGNYFLQFSGNQFMYTQCNRFKEDMRY